MKVLFMVTGRGIGGDAAIALNIAKALSEHGVHCEFALNHDAPGLLFEKNDIKWHETSIPQAGGHAATKLTLVKGGFKIIKAVFEAISLYRKIKPDVVVGSIGGGAVVGCLAAKIAGIPSVGVVSTPTDSKVSKFTTVVVLPESPLFKSSVNNKNVHKVYMPINPEVVSGSREKALELMPEGYDPTLPTILLSSGSTLFEKMALAAPKLRDSGVKANIVVIGHPLDEKYREYLESDGILYLGYIDWVRDLYKLADFVIITDDGVMLHEAIACNLPIITLLRVKYGRYHNMGDVFSGAMVESDLDNLDEVVNDFLENINQNKDRASKYGKDVLESADKIAGIIYEKRK
ncbi:MULTISPECIES: glycosyltransferase [Methanobacterium]|uniref:MurG-like protein n=1 Tax=Methanobacterium bryantii TaxID=2161 RepID=A0A2A2H7A8_METBR|nr:MULTISPECIES: glycosyltransferase [Methanobacterium]OEC87351.1 MurG-like protein [Methanobacterium sp. A39]PAV05309.1 MurG-like protein [Methanobacterium bryantii]